MQMEIRLDCAGIDWTAVAGTLKQVGMGYHEPALHRTAFENSWARVFIYSDGRMIGFGRAMCDGAYQAAVYDVAVVPDCQTKGVGKMIMETILENLPPCNLILYATPGKEGFYEKLAFRKMKTGMARFRDAGRMRARGFTE